MTLYRHLCPRERFALHLRPLSHHTPPPIRWARQAPYQSSFAITTSPSPKSVARRGVGGHREKGWKTVNVEWVLNTLRWSRIVWGRSGRRLTFPPCRHFQDSWIRDDVEIKTGTAFYFFLIIVLENLILDWVKTKSNVRTDRSRHFSCSNWM